MSYDREFFRLKLSVPFSFTVLEAKDPQIARNQTFTYRTQDLSGGGLRFETHLPLVRGDSLQLHLILPTSEPVKVHARVVWSKRSSEEGDEVYKGGLEFVDIDEEEQDRIIGFIFRSQIEARKQGGELEADQPAT